MWCLPVRACNAISRAAMMGSCCSPELHLKSLEHSQWARASRKAAGVLADLLSTGSGQQSAS